MSEKERQQAIKDGNLAEYYRKEAVIEAQSSNWKIGRIKLLTKEKHELLDSKYDLMVQIKKIELALNKINTQIEELKAWHPNIFLLYYSC